jgi:imidazolonepropionase-like amidohydrolase
LLLAFCISCEIGVAAQVTAIKAGHLIDPDSGVVLSDQIILIRDNKIEAVGPACRFLPEPLAGHRILERVNFVMKDGKIYKP